jgi:hypothetical protein
MFIGHAFWKKYIEAMPCFSRRKVPGLFPETVNDVRPSPTGAIPPTHPAPDLDNTPFRLNRFQR